MRKANYGWRFKLVLAYYPDTLLTRRRLRDLRFTTLGSGTAVLSGGGARKNNL